MPDFPYIISHFKEHKELKKSVLKSIHNMRIESVNNGEEIITKSDWYLPKETIRPYMEILSVPLDNHLHEVFYKIKYYNYKVQNFWFNQYKFNATHGKHQHHGISWVCIYYLDIPKHTPITHFINLFDEEVFVPEVNEGDIITFPGFIWHYSPPNTSDKTKTIISLNIK